MGSCMANTLLCILAILFPPLPVWIKRGLCSVDSIINIAFCVLGFVPGLLHAWYIIAATPDDYDEQAYSRVPNQDLEAGGDRNVSVYYVSYSQGGQHNASLQQPQPRDYGTMGQSAQPARSTSEGEVPPTYSEAISGDNKVQTH